MTNKQIKILLTAVACLVALTVAHAGQGINQVLAFTETGTNATAQNITNSFTSGGAIQIPPGVDLALYFSVTGANGGTSNCVAGFNLSPDGVTYTTTYPVSATAVACAGSNVTAVGYTLINRTNLVGSKFIRWDQLGTAQTNLVTASVTASWVQ